MWGKYVQCNILLIDEVCLKFFENRESSTRDNLGENNPFFLSY